MDGHALRREYFAHPKHGPLPALLVLMTVVTGIADAVSVLTLGRVFVANMTGNVVFIGFALAGAPGFSLSASLSALAGFLVGAAIAGRLARRGRHRGLILRNTAAAELVLLIAALAILLAVAKPNEATRGAIAFLIALAMGAQNASVRRLAVPDFTTTVLTMTLTGIAADVPKEGFTVAFRRTLAVVSMFAGAAIGAILVLHAHAATALGVAAVLIAIVVVATAAASRKPAAWHGTADAATG